MAIRIKTYWKTTDAPIEQIKRDIEMCKTQDFKLYYLYKTYGTLTIEDAMMLYIELNGNIKESSLRRSNDTLEENKAIKKTGNTIASSGRQVTMYSLFDDSIIKIKPLSKRIPLTVTTEIYLDENGVLDTDKIYDGLSEKLITLANKFDI